MDSRIGNSFLKTSVGFGGSCFQKDILNLVYIARSEGLDKVADYWEQVLIINQHQRDRFSNKIIDCINKNNLEPKVLLLGWAFKKNTNDTRESPAIEIVKNLIEENAKVYIYDPKVSHKRMADELCKKIEGKNTNQNCFFCENIEETFINADAILITTEWEEFKKIKKPAFIFDGRNILNVNELNKIGFNYLGLGRK